MNQFNYNNDFDKDVIYNKLAEISSKLEEEQNKDKGERDKEKELRLMYAQMIQGLKLNTLFNNRNFYFWIKNKQ